MAKNWPGIRRFHSSLLCFVGILPLFLSTVTFPLNAIAKSDDQELAAMAKNDSTRPSDRSASKSWWKKFIPWGTSAGALGFLLQKEVLPLAAETKRLVVQSMRSVRPPPASPPSAAPALSNPLIAAAAFLFGNDVFHGTRGAIQEWKKNYKREVLAQFREILQELERGVPYSHVGEGTRAKAFADYWEETCLPRKMPDSYCQTSWVLSPPTPQTPTERLRRLAHGIQSKKFEDLLRMVYENPFYRRDVFPAKDEYEFHEYVGQLLAEEAERYFTVNPEEDPSELLWRYQNRNALRSERGTTSNPSKIRSSLPPSGGDSGSTSGSSSNAPSNDELVEWMGSFTKKPRGLNEVKFRFTNSFNRFQPQIDFAEPIVAAQDSETKVTLHVLNITLPTSDKSIELSIFESQKNDEDSKIFQFSLQVMTPGEDPKAILTSYREDSGNPIWSPFGPEYAQRLERQKQDEEYLLEYERAPDSYGSLLRITNSSELLAQILSPAVLSKYEFVPLSLKDISISPDTDPAFMVSELPMKDLAEGNSARDASDDSEKTLSSEIVLFFLEYLEDYAVTSAGMEIWLSADGNALCIFLPLPEKRYRAYFVEEVPSDPGAFFVQIVTFSTEPNIHVFSMTRFKDRFGQTEETDKPDEIPLVIVEEILPLQMFKRDLRLGPFHDQMLITDVERKWVETRAPDHLRRYKEGARSWGERASNRSHPGSSALQEGTTFAETESFIPAPAEEVAILQGKPPQVDVSSIPKEWADIVRLFHEVNRDYAILLVELAEYFRSDKHPVLNLLPMDPIDVDLQVYIEPQTIDSIKIYEIREFQNYGANEPPSGVISEMRLTQQPLGDTLIVERLDHIFPTSGLPIRLRNVYRLRPVGRNGPKP